MLPISTSHRYGFTGDFVDVLVMQLPPPIRIRCRHTYILALPFDYNAELGVACTACRNSIG